MNMFNIESYVTSILLNHVDKFVRDFDPADAKVSLWSGGVTLHNLVLKADVLQNEVPLPFNLLSGRIHELHIKVPWTKIISEPIVVTINTIECILSLDPPPEEETPQEPARTQVEEAPPGYMRALVRKILSNIAVRVNSLIVKYVHDDVVLSLNVKRLSVDNVGPNWEPAFTDVDLPVVRRVVTLDDLTLCLDKSDSDGKIRSFYEPLLYRCQLVFRVLTHLASANNRKARSLSVRLLSSGLTWSVNDEQLLLVLRLLRERSAPQPAVFTPKPYAAQLNTSRTRSLDSSSSSTESDLNESWSDWARSWLPTWMDERRVEETAALATTVPLQFSAYFDSVSLVLKIMERESSGRKRSRAILEVTATDAVVGCSMCLPTSLLIKTGARSLTVASRGRCVCGYGDGTTADEDQAIYLAKIPDSNEEPWVWVEEQWQDQVVETAVVADEELTVEAEVTNTEQENIEQPINESKEESEAQREADDPWHKMAPVVYLEYTHRRSPPDPSFPDEKPPRDFEYSDWVEDCSMNIEVRPIEVNVCTGLRHRLSVLCNVLKELPPVAEPELHTRPLTVEECEALTKNLPIRRTKVQLTGLRVRLVPSEHAERPVAPRLLLDLRIPQATVESSRALYPDRVCLAAAHLDKLEGPLWHGARVHHSAHLSSVQLGICAPDDDVARPCVRAELKLASHHLENKHYFYKRNTEQNCYDILIHEANICGSAPRLQAAVELAKSFANNKVSLALRHTTLARDALNDEDLVAIDVTLEEFMYFWAVSTDTYAHYIFSKTVKATALHSPSGGEVRQAWLFSGPESSSVGYFLKFGVQFNHAAPMSSMLEYVTAIVEPSACSLDTLLAEFLDYQPRLVVPTDSDFHIPGARTKSSSQYLLRQRGTPPSSIGRSHRSGSHSEPVHVRPRSLDSGSEPDERRDGRQTQQTPQSAQCWLSDAQLLQLQDRLSRLLLRLTVGSLRLYIPNATVSAVDCDTIYSAMARFALRGGRPVILCVSQIVLSSDPRMQHLWSTVIVEKPNVFKNLREQDVMDDSFPWKLRVCKVECYTWFVERGAKDKLTSSKSRSKKSTAAVLFPSIVFPEVSTTVALTMAMKTIQIRHITKAEKQPEPPREDEKTKYFTSGIDFKPTSLKDFIRGPIKRKESTPMTQERLSTQFPGYQTTTTQGPPVSVGVNVYADSTPFLMCVDRDQVVRVTEAIHGFAHIIKLLTRPPVIPKQGFPTNSSRGSLARSVSDMEARQSLSDETSENRSEQLISIFESQPAVAKETTLKKFFWFQWVSNHCELMITLQEASLDFQLEGTMCTVDLQTDHRQFKLKITSATVTNMQPERQGLLIKPLHGGLLSVREPFDSKEDNSFLSITVTQAKISNLPEVWKEELLPKHLEQNSNVDTVWEVYVTLAPLEMMIRPDVVEHFVDYVRELMPDQYCPVKPTDSSPSSWEWPIVYINAGGFRLLLNCLDETITEEDTVILNVGKIAVNPQPKNPICRQLVNGNPDAWNSSMILDGRQYEAIMKNFSVRIAKLSDLANEESEENPSAVENPAHKWSQPIEAPIVTPVVHSVDLSCVLAPAVYSGGVLVSGPAAELNLLGDCSVEIGIERLKLMRTLVAGYTQAFAERSSSFLMGEVTTCPYVPFLKSLTQPDTSYIELETANVPEEIKSTIDLSNKIDSGFETATSTFKLNRDSSFAPRKTVSISCLDQKSKASDYLEVFVTSGLIELSLYVKDDLSAEIAALRPPRGVFNEPTDSNGHRIKIKVEEKKDTKTDKNNDEARPSVSTYGSITETTRKKDIGNSKLEELILPPARKKQGNVPLLHTSLQQLSLYYLKKKKQKNFQVTVFDAWFGLGVGQVEGHWNAPLLTTARGSPDPDTEIPLALATLRVDLSSGTYVPLSDASYRNAVHLEIERPVMLDVCSDRLRRIKGIMGLLSMNAPTLRRHVDDVAVQDEPNSLLYRIKHNMTKCQIESVTVVTGQVAIRGSEGAVGWSTLSVQAATGSRPEERLRCSGLVTALVLSSGPPADRRHVVMHPMVAGAQLDATWDNWRKQESGVVARRPSVRVRIDVDKMILELRPSDVAAFLRIRESLQETMGRSETETYIRNSVNENSASSSRTNTKDYHFFDDLRSGAFKIISGSQLPMAYQVTLQDNIISWRYPQPRAIFQITVHPVLEDSEEVVECALEFHCPLLAHWEPHTFFKLPATEPLELYPSTSQTDTVYATTWRIRAYSNLEKDKTDLPFVFDEKIFVPRHDPLGAEPGAAGEGYREGAVNAERLMGALRVSSVHTPSSVPHATLAVRVGALDVHAHDDPRDLPRQSQSLEGYYVSKPLMRSHRFISINMKNTEVHAVVGILPRILLNTNISADILNTADGVMEPLIEEFRARGSVSLNGGRKLFLKMGDVNVKLDIPKLYTLKSMLNDWRKVCNADAGERERRAASSGEANNVATKVLDGRISLWIHNTCSVALRMGQADTDESIPIGAGASLAYRWLSATAPKKLRFAIATPWLDWRWSNGVAFVNGSCRVRLEEKQVVGEANRAGETFLYIRVKDVGVRRDMHLSGRITLANMLRSPLMFKVREKCPADNTWKNVSTGTIDGESVPISVLCNEERDVVFKLRFSALETNRWSGDIPLKECRQDKMPWLVKVPTGESYSAIWCRVVRAHADGRVIATAWPFFMVRSHLPLDAEVTIKSKPGAVTVQDAPSQNEAEAETLSVQTVVGRGATQHLQTPGTASTTHSLTFKYSDVSDCPSGTLEIPLFYGVTKTSVFANAKSVNEIEEIAEDLAEWVRHSGARAESGWPYSIVSNHWPGTWQRPSRQPETEILVNYVPVRVGGGCSLELLIRPLVLIANASPLTLTLRADNGAPLCALEPGVAVAAPKDVMTNPFFLSKEIGRETFVSDKLRVWQQEPGRYGQAPPNHVALDRAVDFAVRCGQLVEMLTMCYEEKEKLNILGITPTFVFINRLQRDVSVLALAVGDTTHEECFLPTYSDTEFDIVEPTLDTSNHGRPLVFKLRERWGGELAELRLLLLLAVSEHRHAVPVRLDVPQKRRPIGLLTETSCEAVVVTQMRHEYRWIVTVAPDPYPQFAVQNKTSANVMLVAQSTPEDMDKGRPKLECSGVKWWNTVRDTVLMYSTPSYCEQYPSLDKQSESQGIFFNFGYGVDKPSPEIKWTEPVEITEGEHLVQLSAESRTIKVRVNKHPYATLVQLMDVERQDISASDIRRRLLKPSASEIAPPQHQNQSATDIRQQPLVSSPNELASPEEDQNQSTSDIRQQPLLPSPNELASPQADQNEPASDVTPSPNEIASPLEGNQTAVGVEDSNDVEGSMVGNYHDNSFDDEDEEPAASSSNQPWWNIEQVSCTVDNIGVTFGTSGHVLPLLAVYLQKTALLVESNSENVVTTVTVGNVQLDNPQYATEQYDFAVVATTQVIIEQPERWSPLWGMWNVDLPTNTEDARIFLRTCLEKWTVFCRSYTDVSEIEIRVGPLALYIEDAYVDALAGLYHLIVSHSNANWDSTAIAEFLTLQRPIRFGRLYIHPLNWTLTVHTAVRIYIALDESPLRLSAFQLQNVMTTRAQLTHALTVHYLSAAILGAGWVVGGLELLGAPGALAARVGNAEGGIRGVASAAAGAMLRSLSAAAGSLARNLDLLAGDDDHARRAAQARRRPPPSLMEGVVTGCRNFAVCLLGAVGGLAHHPVVGVAVGESSSGATGLRRGLLGAITKPLSATADLVAYAGHGLLQQTGWDLVPKPRLSAVLTPRSVPNSWRRDCVHWCFRLAELTAIAGFSVQRNNAEIYLIITHRFLVIIDPQSQNIEEMIDCKACTLKPFQGPTVEIQIRKKSPRTSEPRLSTPNENENEYQMSAAAMARVARFTGSEVTVAEGRVVSVVTSPADAHALHAALAAALQHNSAAHFQLL
ncbi:intermembrane lipid transfer protein VPS13B isoform X2 [Bicyclus anynana]|uniref:Intermembrane lipid transfer protein VPS13B isoform X2 n=1 Tax=Bicyclus anynana TaxID=110368 RepID=A0ABM3M4P2_BICAN|nr:intermembrane lipid transfer protein VPS13B isoform X2 [Bicyclus anynana]